MTGTVDQPGRPTAASRTKPARQPSRPPSSADSAAVSPRLWLISSSAAPRILWLFLAFQAAKSTGPQSGAEFLPRIQRNASRKLSHDGILADHDRLPHPLIFHQRLQSLDVPLIDLPRGLELDSQGRQSLRRRECCTRGWCEHRPVSGATC